MSAWYPEGQKPQKPRRSKNMGDTPKQTGCLMPLAMLPLRILQALIKAIL